LVSVQGAKSSYQRTKQFEKLSIRLI
jgi:hypothetical protein